MFTRKCLRMGISTVLSAVMVAACPVMTFATGAEEVIVFGSGSNASDLEMVKEAMVEAGITDEENEYDIDEEEIWALIDKDDLRSFVDVEALRESIDNEALLEKLDIAELLSEIDEADLARQVDNDQHPVDVINVKMPIIGEDSPFDFIIDPLGLIYETDAAKYGGGRVEEGATILFRNSEGDYLFSSQSDVLTVSNHGNVPVHLTIKATITNPGGIDFVDSRSQLEGENPRVFMALCDGDGIGSVMTENGEARMDVVLGAAPEEAYSFSWNESKKRYDYVLDEDIDEDVFESFSFNVYADCNEDGNWDNLLGVPTIKVSWETEPIEPDKDELDKTVEQYESEIEAMIADYLDTHPYQVIESKIYPTTPIDAGSNVEDDNREMIIIDEVVPESDTAVADDHEQDQVELRSEKIAKLRKEELIKKATFQFKKLLEEELERLINEEVERLAKEQFDEIKAEMIRTYKETEKEITENVATEEDVLENDESMEPVEDKAKDAATSEASEYIQDTDETVQDDEQESEDTEEAVEETSEETTGEATEEAAKTEDDVVIIG